MAQPTKKKKKKKDARNGPIKKAFKSLTNIERMCYGEGQDFVYFRLFSQYNNKYNTKFDYKWKQDRRHAWDSNPAPQNGRLRQIH